MKNGYYEEGNNLDLSNLSKNQAIDQKIDPRLNHNSRMHGWTFSASGDKSEHADIVNPLKESSEDPSPSV